MAKSIYIYNKQPHTCFAPDTDAAAVDCPLDGGYPDWAAVSGHRERGDEGVQQRGLSVLHHSLPHVLSTHAHRSHMYVQCFGTYVT